MLKKFEVKGYKNFKNNFIFDFSDVRNYDFNQQCIENNLVNNAILYGKNARGKTNLGNAIMDVKYNFYREFYMFDDEQDNYLNADSNVEYAEFKYIFKFDEDEVEYYYQKTNRFKINYEKLTINQQLLFEYDYKNKIQKTNYIDLINLDTLNWDLIKEDNEISILNYIISHIPMAETNVLMKTYTFIKNMCLITNRTKISPMFRGSIRRIIEKNQVKELEKFLNDFGIEEKLTVMETPSGEKELYFNHKKPISVIRNTSSGTDALIQLFRYYKEIENLSFLYIDEFDAFYHYELSESVIKMLGKIKNCQTITTSHNTNLLSNQIMRPDCFFILTKEKVVSIVNATDRELKEEHNLENLYKSGEFGK